MQLRVLCLPIQIKETNALGINLVASLEAKDDNKREGRGGNGRYSSQMISCSVCVCFQISKLTTFVCLLVASWWLQKRLAVICIPNWWWWLLFCILSAPSAVWLCLSFSLPVSVQVSVQVSRSYWPRQLIICISNFSMAAKLMAANQFALEADAVVVVVVHLEQTGCPLQRRGHLFASSHMRPSELGHANGAPRASRPTRKHNCK